MSGFKSQQPQDKRDGMKLIQLNAWLGNLKLNLVEFLKEEDADILNLQEVSDGFGTSADYLNLRAILRKELRYRYSSFVPMSRGTMNGIPVSEGNMVLSKYPIRSARVFYVSRPRRANLLFSGRANSIPLQYVRIEAEGRTIHDFNYHEMLVWGRFGNQATAQHSRRVAERMASLDQDEMIILCGDFNQDPRSGTLDAINKSYTNLVLKHRIKTTRNELAFDTVPVDNIFVNAAVRVRSVRSPKVYVSDHLPVIMSFD